MTFLDSQPSPRAHDDLCLLCWLLTDLTEKWSLPTDYTLREDEQIIGIGPLVDHMLDDLFDKTYGKTPV